MMSNRSRTPGENEDRREQFEREEMDTRSAGRMRRNRPVRGNQKRLGVNQEHKTETMRKRNRGTFP